MHRSVFLVYGKYTRETLKYGGKEEQKSKNSKKLKLGADYWTLPSICRGIGTIYFSTLTLKSLDLQSSLCSTLSKYSTLNIKESTSKLLEHYYFLFVLTNISFTLLGITQTTPAVFGWGICSRILLKVVFWEFIDFPYLS